MEASILKSTKKILGLADDYTAFDLDILTHINSVFSTLQQLGIGPVEGFAIEDDGPIWDTYLNDDLRLNMVKTYVHLRVKLIFDPPTTGFVTDAMKEQIKEFEWRLNNYYETVTYVPDAPDLVFDGGDAGG